MPDNKTKRQELYDYLKSQNKVNISFDQFSEGLKDQTKSRELYDYLSNSKITSLDYDSFMSGINEGYSAQPSAQPQAVAQPAETEDDNYIEVPKDDFGERLKQRRQQNYGNRGGFGAVDYREGAQQPPQPTKPLWKQVGEAGSVENFNQQEGGAVIAPNGQYLGTEKESQQRVAVKPNTNDQQKVVLDDELQYIQNTVLNDLKARYPKSTDDEIKASKKYEYLVNEKVHNLERRRKGNILNTNYTPLVPRDEYKDDLLTLTYIQNEEDWKPKNVDEVWGKAAGWYVNTVDGAKSYAEFKDKKIDQEEFLRRVQKAYPSYIEKGEIEVGRQQVHESLDVLNAALAPYDKVQGSDSRAFVNMMMNIDAGDKFNTSAQNYVMSDEAQQSKLVGIAQGLRDKLTQEIDAVEHNNGMWSQLGKGFKDSVTSLDNWIAANGLSNNLELKRISEKVLNDETLSNEEQLVYDAMLTKAATDFYFGKYLSGGYKAGATTGASIPFMVEFALLPYSKCDSIIGKALSKFAGKYVSKIGAKVITPAIMTTIFDAPAVAADAVANTTGASTPVFDESQGKFVPGNYYEGMSVGEGIWKAWASRYAENLSERAVDPVKDKVVGFIGKKIAKSPIGEAANHIINNPIARATHFSGIGGEWLEEAFGAGVEALMTWDKQPLEEFDAVETFEGLLPMQAAFGLLGLGGFGFHKGTRLGGSMDMQNDMENFFVKYGEIVPNGFENEATKNITKESAKAMAETIGLYRDKRLTREQTYEALTAQRRIYLENILNQFEQFAKSDECKISEEEKNDFVANLNSMKEQLDNDKKKKEQQQNSSEQASNSEGQTEEKPAEEHQEQINAQPAEEQIDVYDTEDKDSEEHLNGFGYEKGVDEDGDVYYRFDLADGTTWKLYTTSFEGGLAEMADFVRYVNSEINNGRGTVFDNQPFSDSREQFWKSEYNRRNNKQADINTNQSESNNQQGEGETTPPATDEGNNNTTNPSSEEGTGETPPPPAEEQKKLSPKERLESEKDFDDDNHYARIHDVYNNGHAYNMTWYSEHGFVEDENGNIDLQKTYENNKAHGCANSGIYLIDDINEENSPSHAVSKTTIDKTPSSNLSKTYSRLKWEKANAEQLAKEAKAAQEKAAAEKAAEEEKKKHTLPTKTNKDGSVEYDVPKFTPINWIEYYRDVKYKGQPDWAQKAKAEIIRALLTDKGRAMDRMWNLESQLNSERIGEQQRLINQQAQERALDDAIAIMDLMKEYGIIESDEDVDIKTADQALRDKYFPPKKEKKAKEQKEQPAKPKALEEMNGEELFAHFLNENGETAENCPKTIEDVKQYIADAMQFVESTNEQLNKPIAPAKKVRLRGEIKHTNEVIEQLTTELERHGVSNFVPEVASVAEETAKSQSTRKEEKEAKRAANKAENDKLAEERAAAAKEVEEQRRKEKEVASRQHVIDNAKEKYKKATEGTAKKKSLDTLKAEIDEAVGDNTSKSVTQLKEQADFKAQRLTEIGDELSALDANNEGDENTARDLANEADDLHRELAAMPRSIKRAIAEQTVKKAEPKQTNGKKAKKSEKVKGKKDGKKDEKKSDVKAEEEKEEDKVVLADVADDGITIGIQGVEKPAYSKHEIRTEEKKQKREKFIEDCKAATLDILGSKEPNKSFNNVVILKLRTKKRGGGNVGKDLPAYIALTKAVITKDGVVDGQYEKLTDEQRKYINENYDVILGDKEPKCKIIHRFSKSDGQYVGISIVFRQQFDKTWETQVKNFTLSKDGKTLNTSSTGNTWTKDKEGRLRPLEISENDEVMNQIFNEGIYDWAKGKKYTAIEGVSVTLNDLLENNDNAKLYLSKLGGMLANENSEEKDKADRILSKIRGDVRKIFNFAEFHAGGMPESMARKGKPVSFDTIRKNLGFENGSFVDVENVKKYIDAIVAKMPTKEEYAGAYPIGISIPIYDQKEDEHNEDNEREQKQAEAAQTNKLDVFRAEINDVYTNVANGIITQEEGESQIKGLIADLLKEDIDINTIKQAELIAKFDRFMKARNDYDAERESSKLAKNILDNIRAEYISSIEELLSYGVSVKGIAEYLSQQEGFAYDEKTLSDNFKSLGVDLTLGTNGAAELISEKVEKEGTDVEDVIADTKEVIEEGGTKFPAIKSALDELASAYDEFIENFEEDDTTQYEQRIDKAKESLKEAIKLSEDSSEDLTKYVNEFEEQIKEQFNDEVVESVIKTTRKFIEQKSKGKLLRSADGRVLGWYDTTTGEVYIESKDVSKEQYERTKLHELVAHKGLRHLLGDKFDALCDTVYDYMEKHLGKDEYDYYKHYAEMELPEGAPELAVHRTMADEWMAHRAEYGVSQHRSIWNRIVDFIRAALRDLGFDLEWSERDVAMLLYESSLQLNGREMTAAEVMEFNAVYNHISESEAGIGYKAKYESAFGIKLVYRTNGVSAEENAAYMEAARRGDEEKCKEMLDVIAERFGYVPSKHGTDNGGFVKIDMSKSDDKISFFSAPGELTAGTYTKNNGNKLSTNKNKELEEIKTIEDAKRILGIEIKEISKPQYEEYFDEVSGETSKEFVGYSIEYEITDLNGNKSKAYSEEDIIRKANIKYWVKQAFNRNSGIYDLYVRFETPLHIDAKGANWDSIPLDQEAEHLFIRLKPVDYYDQNGAVTLSVGTEESVNNEDNVKYFDSYDAANEYISNTYGGYAGAKIGEIYTSTDFEQLVNEGRDDLAAANFDFYFNQRTKKPSIVASTRQIAEQARDDFYDGVIIDNVTDNGGMNPQMWNLPPETIYISFNPNQIKSAEAITYDDNGEIIPLHRRFDERTNDIRYKREIEKDQKPMPSDYQKPIRVLCNKMVAEVADSFKPLKMLREELYNITKKRMKFSEDFVEKAKSILRNARGEYEIFHRTLMLPFNDVRKDIIRQFQKMHKGKMMTAKMWLDNYMLAKDYVERIDLSKKGYTEEGAEQMWNKDPDTQTLKKKLQDAYGVTFGSLRDFVEKSEAEFGDTTELWSKFRAMSYKICDMLKEHNILSDKEYAEMKARQFYVPQRNADVSDGNVLDVIFATFEKDNAERQEQAINFLESKANEARSKTTGGRFTALRKALGRKSLAAMPVERMGSIAFSSFRDCYRNDALKAFFDQVAVSEEAKELAKRYGITVEAPVMVTETDAENNKTKRAALAADFAEMAEKKKAIKEFAKEIFKLQRDKAKLQKWLNEHKDYEGSLKYDIKVDARDFLKEQIKAKKEEWKQMNAEANAKFSTQRVENSRNDNQMIMKLDGNTYRFTVANNVYGNMIAQSFDYLPPKKYFLIASFITRLFSRTVTSRNPFFAPKNLKRGMEYSVAAAFVERGAGFAWSIAKNAFKIQNVIPIAKYVWGKKDIEDPTFKEFVRLGGSGSFTSNMSDLEAIAKELDRELSDKKIDKILYYNDKVLTFLSQVTEMYERYTIFKAAKANGFTSEEALAESKELDVNFDTSGRTQSNFTALLKSIIPFFGASVNSLVALKRSIKDENVPHRSGGVGAARARAGLVIANNVAKGMIVTLLGKFILDVLVGGGDDDEEEEMLMDYANGYTDEYDGLDVPAFVNIMHHWNKYNNITGYTIGNIKMPSEQRLQFAGIGLGADLAAMKLYDIPLSTSDLLIYRQAQRLLSCMSPVDFTRIDDLPIAKTFSLIPGMFTNEDEAYYLNSYYSQKDIDVAISKGIYEFAHGEGTYGQPTLGNDKARFDVSPELIQFVSNSFIPAPYREIVINAYKLSLSGGGTIFQNEPNAMTHKDSAWLGSWMATDKDNKQRVSNDVVRALKNAVQNAEDDSHISSNVESMTQHAEFNYDELRKLKDDIDIAMIEKYNANGYMTPVGIQIIKAELDNLSMFDIRKKAASEGLMVSEYKELMYDSFKQEGMSDAKAAEEVAKRCNEMEKDYNTYFVTHIVPLYLEYRNYIGAAQKVDSDWLNVEDKRELTR